MKTITENTICYSKVDIPYLTSDGKQMVLTTYLVVNKEDI
jgi:hypothetical protein